MLPHHSTMAHYVCVLQALFWFETVSLALGQTSECGDISWCQTSINTNCLCYKMLPGDKYGVCSCTYSYSLDMFAEKVIRECCLMQASIGDTCINNSQCELSDTNLICTAGVCQCQNEYEYSNETESCVAKPDFHGATATVAIGTTCIVLTLVIVLLILLFMHRKATTERQIRYLQSRVNTRGTHSPSNADSDETVKDLTPPSYNEIERGETPPPPFESLTSISDDNEIRGSE